MKFKHQNIFVFCGFHRPPDERPRVEGWAHAFLAIQALKFTI